MSIDGPEDVLRAAHALERDALKARARGDHERADRLELAALKARELVKAWARLQERTVTRTMGHMDTTESRELKIGKAKVGDHPFPKALHERGKTVTEWAEAQVVPKGQPRLTREKVSSWYKPGKGGRRIPREWAVAIERDFGVPLSAWPHGIK